jgi:hypothetical protein
MSPARRPAEVKSSRWSRLELLLVFLIAVLAAVTSFRDLGRSLWLDETLTYWASEGSLRELFARVVHYQGQTPFSFLSTWLMVHLFGASEAALRAPAIVAYLLSTVLVFRIGSMLVRRETGLIAAFLFHGFWATTYGMPDARPYTFAVFWLLLATFCLVRWDEEGRSVHLWIYVLSLLAAVYAHILFASVGAVHAAYLVARGGVPEERRRPLSLAVMGFAIGFAPIAFLLIILRSKWELYSFAPMPTAADLLVAWMWLGLWVISVPIVVTASRGVKPHWTGRVVGGRQWLLLWMWSLWPALSLFLVSHYRGESVFVPRYFAWQLPGIALLLAVALSGFTVIQVRRVGSAILVIALLILGLLSPARYGEDWRGAVEFANGVVAGRDTPILVWTGLVESKDLEWFQAAENRDYMLAPFFFYRLAGRVIPVPHPMSVDQLEDFMSDTDAGALRREPTVWVLAYDPFAAVEIARWTSPPRLVVQSSERFGRITVTRLNLGPQDTADDDAGVAFGAVHLRGMRQIRRADTVEKSDSR